MRLYIAGPMWGLPDFNYPAFFRAADQLASAGFDPINPARPEGRSGCRTWLDYVARRGASNWSKREDSTWIDKL